MTELELKQQIIQAKNQRGLTNQQLADLSGVPIGTVAGITSPNNSRAPSYATALRLMQVLQMDTAAVEQETDRKEDDLMDNSIYQTLFHQLKESHEAELQRMTAAHESILRNKEKWMNRLFWVCIALGLLFAVSLIWALKLDSMIPDFGMIQY